MKTKLIIFLMLVAFSVGIAATLTITIPTNDVPRVQAAFGDIYNFGGPATLPQVQNAVTQWIIGQTKNNERTKIAVPPLEMQPSPTPTATATPTATPTATATATATP